MHVVLDVRCHYSIFCFYLFPYRKKIDMFIQSQNLCLLLVLSSGYCIPRHESHEDILQRKFIIELKKDLNTCILLTFSCAII
ncbi:MAG: hypothetical protein D5S03_06670 [Desulfonatronospira sp. MSAO_Bac3]|nr:MAG: hypothetical protein D5S03_06670 [Desulfonatronospira sp. MSAO_Bac3]